MYDRAVSVAAASTHIPDTIERPKLICSQPESDSGPGDGGMIINQMEQSN